MTRVKVYTGKDIVISIHTPARGVTGDKRGFYKVGKISIHTPARGVTRTLFPHIVKPDHFNPHSRKGSDIIEEDLKFIVINISIHTPARGVTLETRDPIYLPIDFNPHSRKGSDLMQ